MAPRVSVLMSVYNGEKYLKESIESILSQTYSDFEFIIIDDGSTDNSLKIIKAFPDQRIRLVCNKKNIGLANSLNRGIKLAQGEYILRMDADDISLPNRITKQVKYMDANPDIDISGVWIKHIMQDKKEKLIWKFPTDPAMISFTLLFYNPIGHNTVIIRKKLFSTNKLLYDPSYETAEDYDLWVRASKFSKMSNLGKVLVLYRRHYEQIGVKKAARQKKVSLLIVRNQLKELDLAPIKENLNLHKLIGHNKAFDSKEDVIKAKIWLEKLRDANEKKMLFPDPGFSEFLATKWFKICTSGSDIGIWHLKTYYSSELSRLNKIYYIIFFKFIVKCFMKHIKDNGQV